VSAGATGAVCDYCCGNNLVRVPAAWVKSVSASTATISRAVDEVVAAHRHEVAGLRGRLRARLIGWAVVAALFLGILWVGLAVKDPFSSYDDWPPSWNADTRAKDRRLHGHRHHVRASDIGIHPDKLEVERCHETWLDVHLGAWGTAEACDDEGCTFRWIVALRRGERLTFHTAELPEGTMLTFYRHDPGASFEDDDFAKLATAPISAETPATFEAAMSAYYAVGTRIVGMTADEGRSLCIELSR